MATVEIKGLQGVIDKLNRLGKNLDTVVDNSLHESATIIEQQAVQNIQNMSVSYNGRIYDAKETGILQGSLYTRKLGNCRYTVATKISYAPYVEFGVGSAGDPIVAHNVSDMTVITNGKRAGTTVHFAPQPPRPFLLPAFRSHRDIIKQNIINAIIRAATETTGGTV